MGIVLQVIHYNLFVIVKTIENNIWHNLQMNEVERFVFIK